MSMIVRKMRYISEINVYANIECIYRMHICSKMPNAEYNHGEQDLKIAPSLPLIL